jgi:hypothetical protein
MRTNVLKFDLLDHLQNAGVQLARARDISMTLDQKPADLIKRLALLANEVGNIYCEVSDLPGDLQIPKSGRTK